MSASSRGELRSPVRVCKERWPGGDPSQIVPLVAVGEMVRADQPIFKLQKDQQTIPSGLSGLVRSITPRHGVLLESSVVALQCVLGVGRQVPGVLTLWPSESVAEAPPLIPGAILIVQSTLSLSLLYRALQSGVAGIIAGSIALRDLEGFLRTDIIELLDRSESEIEQLPLPSVTLLFTEGLGTSSMSAQAFDLLHAYTGSVALLTGYTSRFQRCYPEIVISFPNESTRAIHSAGEREQDEIALDVGSFVRVRGGKANGEQGIIEYLFLYEQVFASGIRTRAASVRLADGAQRTVPVGLLERIV
ncbi:hypothetical protein [Tengunoibacter tsumagoiensis]|uniref:RnfC Barrel sandwich hybrid domain-containing protein n=1 Tax=Tengunoibacter tsumagoiensis TaxID=2014871 RepID=A0A402A5G6_9CHLR|nr:hypothetical protein [Tengunoibacter tsumagoiensis]GCE14319.1 hypothetical protein KTT_41780 [Tengunoibacter tsumagoiensis]